MLPDLVPHCSDSNKIRLQASATSALQQKPRTTPATAPPPHPRFSFSFSPRTTTPRNDTKFRRLVVTKDSRERERERELASGLDFLSKFFLDTSPQKLSRQSLDSEKPLFLVPDDERENKNMQAIEINRRRKTNNNCLKRKLANDHEHKKETTTTTVGTPTAICRQQPPLRDGSTARPVTTPPSETTARPDYQNGRCWI
jgi:hypothetical protein